MSDNKVREYNMWIRHMMSLNEKDRHNWVEKILEEMINNGKRDLAELIASKDCEIIGFVPFCEYVRVYADKRARGDTLSQPYNHCISTPALLVWHKKLKMFMIAGSGLKWNKSEFPVDVMGMTE
jgi:hypothetical protein